MESDSTRAHIDINGNSKDSITDAQQSYIIHSLASR
jgi:hypothetical protein